MIHTLDWPLGFDNFGGGFIYGMQNDQLIVGLVVGLDYKNPLLDPHLEFQRLKTHPEIAKMLEGGKMAFYGAKAIPEGGWWSMPRPYGDGFLIVGDSAGMLNSQRLKGIHLGMKSGMLAAETIVEALKAGGATRRAAGRLPGEDRRELDQGGALAGAQLPPGLRPRPARRLAPGGPRAGDRRPRLGGQGPAADRARPRADDPAQHARGAAARKPRRRSPIDGKLTFDRLADVYNSGTAHDEDQPVHLLVADTDICIYRCTVEYANPCQRFCPAAVYEMVADPASPTGDRLQINASNCVHCKTCDIMDPYQIITWVPPEGGDGPNYGKM